MIIQKQEWKAFTRYFISNAFGSVMMNLYDKPQECESKFYTAWIWGLYVCPQYRRKGYAKLLLKEAERIALENGHKDVYMAWDAKETPRDILDFYVREGYMLASDEVVLCKELMEDRQ